MLPGSVGTGASRLPRPRPTWFLPEEFGIDLAIPFMKVLAHRKDFVGLPFRQILLFPEISCEIEKVHSPILESFNQLVVALPDRPAGKSSLI